jgi:two-component system, NarL family, response regulator LiaR
MDNSPIQVLIADDHAMVRRGIIALLQQYDGITVVGDAADGFAAVELAKELRPDVMLVDLLMPKMDGIETIKRILAAIPEQRIIVLTAQAGDENLVKAIRAGAMGFLAKDTQPEELIHSIQEVYEGRPALDSKVVWKLLQAKPPEEQSNQTPQLSPRELEVLILLTKGKTDREIAEHFVLTEVTVRTHVSRILNKLNLNSRVEAALYSIRTGLVSMDEVFQLDMQEH